MLKILTFQTSFKNPKPQEMTNESSSPIPAKDFSYPKV